jgi:hypothetical protein
MEPFITFVETFLEFSLEMEVQQLVVVGVHQNLDI